MKRYQIRKENWYGMNWIRKDKRLAIYRRDDFSCVYCGSREKLTLDHVIPHNDGGSNEADNLVTCCHECNCSRGKKSLRAFAKAAVKRVLAALKADLKPHRSEAKKLLKEHGGFSKVMLAMAS